ncbi:MAG: hypothetical protein V1704_00485 [Candidatus Vogelbacteria bacterium]
MVTVTEKIPYPVQVVAMHEGPHLDEVVALVLLHRFGRALFPGIETARVVFWPYGGQTPDGASAENWLERGVLLLGQGSGMFDEHPDPKYGIPRKQGHSTTSLVAEYLDLDSKSPEGRAVAWLTKQVTDCDLNGGSGVLSIESVMTAMYRNGRSSNEMLEQGIIMMENFLDDQTKFQRAYDLACVGGSVSYRRCGNHMLASITSTSEHILKATRSRGARLSIRRDSSTGHVTIMADHKAGLPLGDLVSELRRFENYGKLPIDTCPDEEGRLDNWFYHPQIGLITTGGGRAAKNTRPSRRSWSEIFLTIESWLKKQL